MSIDDMIASARATAERFLGRAVEFGLELSPAYRNLKEMLDSTAAAERELVDLLGRIKALDAVGYASMEDFYAFNRLANSTTRIQRGLLAATRRLFRDRPDVLSHLPAAVTPWPPLMPSSYENLLPAGSPYAGVGAGAEPQAAQPGVSGLGALPALALAPWMVCAIIIAAIVGLTVVAVVFASTLGVTVESISNVIIVREQIRAHRLMLESRMQIYNDCIAREGQTPQSCSRIAVETAPAPDIKFPAAPGGWIKWVAIGLGVAAVAGVGGYFLYQRSKTSTTPKLAGAAKYKPIRAERFPYESADDQGLPV